MPNAKVAQAILSASVQKVVGHNNATPRPGQQRLFVDVCDVMNNGEHGVFSAPTGSGKTLATLAPAFAAATEGERTVISTESLTLQDQILDKDAPVVAAATLDLTSCRPTVALLKGFSNYACLLAATRTARSLTGLDTHDPDELADAVSDPALKWILQREGDGEKSRCPSEITQSWATVSIGADDCLGDRCPFVDDCYPRRAREAAATADIVVTNHATLGMQVAQGIPAVMGRVNEIRPFSHIIVDECHALPDTVRNAGNDSFSASRFVKAVNRFSKTMTRFGHSEQRLVAEGMRVAPHLEAELHDVVAQFNPDGYHIFGPEDDPLAATGEAVAAWFLGAKKAADRAKERSESLSAQLTFKQLARQMAAAHSTVVALSVPPSTVARWAEHGPDGVVLQFSPVDVRTLCRDRLWSYTPADSETAIALSVTCVSATVGEEFLAEAGMTGSFFDYPTPFAAAYGESVLHVPSMAKGSEMATACSVNGRFDVNRHAVWATSYITKLVKANNGSALVLAAKADNGKTYAEALRSAGLNVIDQWSSASVRQAIAAWKNNPGSVLVGTRSLMTGVDAPGDTCTLVVIDRIPRKPINALDEARVATVVGADVEDGMLWAGRSKVYGADAARLVAQATGRLIRKESDRGMVAILDPRLWPSADNAFRSSDRKRYLEALGPFGHKVTSATEALGWLRTQSRRTRKEARVSTGG